MSGGGTEAHVGCEAATAGSGVKKRDSLGTASAAHLIIRGTECGAVVPGGPHDLGEIQSRLLDHRPVIQGETHYFVKEFEEKRGLREMRVLENLQNMICETKEHTLPKCRDAMESDLKGILQRLQAANDSVHRLQRREQERRKMYNDHLVASEKQHQLQWEDLMKEQPHRQAEVDAEHQKAMERLKEQYAEMEKDLAKFSTF
ncbi:biogenesis of lysosome-related organelles complex 1 subunit 5 isoform X1 [Heterocephalus glaber]|uniref:Biogenesis of lysosome-related organelles complex 1 subunit 5 n=1 Tax=Heterocephalus glaber TaxID=10181 RepID=A0AAX6PAV5_HETGA|nr:biogenesis of lysosome-related organelles complex 1 subunit 5 isoform X1 [Heterocephalus glaber]